MLDNEIETNIRLPKLVINKDEVKEMIQKLLKKGNRLEYEVFIDEDFKIWKDFINEYLKRCFDIPMNSYQQKFENAGLSSYLNRQLSPHKRKLAELHEKNTYLDGFLLQLDLFSCADMESEESAKKYDKKNIFIVHGHNESLKYKVARILEKLSLTPIILHEQPNQGKTIIEKFEENAKKCGFAIILLTADDEGRSLKEKEKGVDFSKRARQNVILEMGFFIGKLGRERVFLLLDKGVEEPSDLSGIVYNSIEDDSWKSKLVQELNICGYNVDENKIINSSFMNM